jgi:hypothetical protein
MNEIRTDRRFGVTAELKPVQRARLASLYASDVWPDALDVMEQCCIEIETELINTPASQKEAVLANHELAQAAWRIFTHFQEKIKTETFLYMESVAPKTPVPELTAAERWAENVLDPLKTPPTDDDYMGM